MSIYRGPGGPGDAVNDSSSEAAITVIAKDAALAAQAAAELAENNAATSASSAATSATTATTQASNASTSATNAANSATLAASYTPSQTGNAGKYLKTDGTAVSWDALDISTADISGTLPVANGGTGQTTKAAAFNALSPVTSTGDLIIGNGANSNTRLPIGTTGYLLTSNGTTATWAAAPVSLPSQTGNSGKYLTTDGTTASWATVGGGQYFGTAATKAIAYNASTIAENISVTENAMSVGPITISSGYSVTVSSGKRWVIL